MRKHKVYGCPLNINAAAIVRLPLMAAASSIATSRASLLMNKQSVCIRIHARLDYNNARRGSAASRRRPVSSHPSCHPAVRISYASAGYFSPLMDKREAPRCYSEPDSGKKESPKSRQPVAMTARVSASLRGIIDFAMHSERCPKRPRRAHLWSGAALRFACRRTRCDRRGARPMVMEGRRSVNADSLSAMLHCASSVMRCLFSRCPLKRAPTVVS